MGGPQFRSAVNPAYRSGFQEGANAAFINPTIRVPTHKGQQPVNVPSVENPTKYGWNPDLCSFEKIDPYFPKEMLKLTIKKSNIDGALRRMAECFQTHSIQVEFDHSPAGAKLRTMEHIELYLIFFEYDNGDLAIDIQRRQGDYLDANRYIHLILESAKGMSAEAQPQEAETAPHNATRISEFENFLDRCAEAANNANEQVGNVSSPWAKPPTVEESIKNTLNGVHASLTSDRLGERKVGLENLQIFTDLDKTLSQTAIATALVAVAGKSPAAGYGKKCEEISKVLVRVIMKQDFAGDDTNMYADMDTDIVGFLSSDNAGTNTEGRSKCYDQYMAEMHHLVLNILANSVEVLQVFNDSNVSYDMGEAASQLNFECFSCSDGNAGIVEALIRLVGQADKQLPDAYLACKALRHLLAASKDLQNIFKNGKYQEPVKRAKSAGSHNAKLKSEVEKLEILL